MSILLGGVLSRESPFPYPYEMLGSLGLALGIGEKVEARRGVTLEQGSPLGKAASGKDGVMGVGDNTS